VIVLCTKTPAAASGRLYQRLHRSLCSSACTYKRSHAVRPESFKAIEPLGGIGYNCNPLGHVRLFLSLAVLNDTVATRHLQPATLCHGVWRLKHRANERRSRVWKHFSLPAKISVLESPPSFPPPRKASSLPSTASLLRAFLPSAVVWSRRTRRQCKAIRFATKHTALS
jgi:hypothetical protein